MRVRSRPHRIVILGGSGFVGRSLARQLDARGETLRIPTRRRARHRDLLVLPSVELVEADVHDEPTLSRLLASCDTAVNLIGILNERGHSGAGFHHAHRAFAAKLVRAAAACGVRRLLQVSALKADADYGPSHYLRSKGAAEREIEAGAAAGIRYTILRPSVIFGPQDSFINRFAALLRGSPILPLACAEARFAPVFVEDVAAALVAALDDTRTYDRVYELCGPEIFTLEEIVRLVRRQLGLRRAIVPLPPVLGRTLAWLGEYWLPGKPFSLDNYRSLGVASVCADNGGCAALGIAPQSLTALLPRCLETGGSDALATLRRNQRR